MTEAKAILAAEVSGDGRAAYEEYGVLNKIIEDGSIKSLIDSSATDVYLPNVKFIARSPVEGKKDLYICFDQYLTLSYKEIEDKSGDWKYITIPGFIHVKEDGTVVSILGEQDYYTSSSINIHQNNDPVTFDGLGNVYFTASEHGYNNNTNIIYQYNPETEKLSQMTAAVPNISYDHVLLTTDGTLLVAKGNSWNSGSYASFLRLIPTANPDTYSNLFYSSGGNDNSLNSFVINPDTKEAFISGRNLMNDDKGVLYRVSFGGATKTWTPLFVNNSNRRFYSEFFGVLYIGNSNYLVPKSQFAKTESETEPDYDKIMDYIYADYKSDYIEYRYDNKVNQEALEAIVDAITDDSGAIINLNEYNYYTYDSHCYITGSDEKAVYKNVYNVNKLVIAPDKSVWSFAITSDNNKYLFCRLVNSDGKRDLIVPKKLEQKVIKRVIPAENYIYFIADVREGGGEEGFHNIYRISLNNLDEVENLFDNIRSRDTLHMDVFDFAIGGGFLYFSGVQGVYLLTGKIDLNTGLYTELEFGHKVTHIVSY